MKLTALALLPLAALAQHHPAPPPENPVALYKGLGIWHHAISTSNPDAQKFFDQGLSLLYGFNRYEALRSFRKASQLDPRSVMAYWGMAMAQGPYINMDGDPSYDQKGACAAVDAGSKISGAPERERAYLAAVAAWCPEYKPPAYIDAMRALSARYPDDLDARTIYAESLMIPVRWHWYTAGKPADGVLEAERQLEEVLRRWPDHPGANHYYIHAVESSPTPERAIASAQRLMGLVPAAGHMVHMPGHIWLVLGDWKTAADVNERAAEVDRQYFKTTNVIGGSYAPYYAHNLHFIMYARTMEGRRADSLRASDTLAEVLAPLADAMPEMADMFVPVPAFAYMRFGEWDHILNLPAPKPEMKLSTVFWHYGRALAYAGKGDSPGAAKERDAFLKARDSVAADAGWGQNKASDVLAMVAEVLEGRLAASPGTAVPHYRRAVELQDAFTYDEPPAWYYPVRESLGAALLRARQPADAENVFREGVRRTPRDGRMLFGLMQALTAQGKTDDAASLRREFDAAWAKADVQLRIDDM